VLSDVLEHPSFPQAEIDRVRARRLTALQQQKNSVQSQAFNAVSAAVYGRANPYGHSLSGVAADAKAVTRDDLVRAYSSLFAPGNISIAVCGDTTAAALRTELEARFGAFRGGAAIKPVYPAAPPAAQAASRTRRSRWCSSPTWACRCRRRTATR
jgi:zinc protease